MTEDEYEWKQVDGLHYWRITGTSDSWTLWNEDSLESTQDHSVSDSVVMGNVNHNKTTIINDTDALISAYSKGLHQRNIDIYDSVTDLENNQLERDFPTCKHCNHSLEKIETILSANDLPNWQGNENWKDACFFCKDSEYKWDRRPETIYRHRFDEIDFSICQTCLESKSWETELSELQFAEHKSNIREFDGINGLKSKNSSKTIAQIIADGNWQSTQKNLCMEGASIDAYIGFPRKDLWLGAFSTIYPNENMLSIAKGDFGYNNTCYFKYLSEKRKILFDNFIVSFHSIIQKEHDEKYWRNSEVITSQSNLLTDILSDKSKSNARTFLDFMELRPSEIEDTNKELANTNRFLRNYFQQHDKYYSGYKRQSFAIGMLLVILFSSILIHNFIIPLQNDGAELLFIVPIFLIVVIWINLVFSYYFPLFNGMFSPYKVKGSDGKKNMRCPGCGLNYPKKWRKIAKSHKIDCYAIICATMENHPWLPPYMIIPFLAGRSVDEGINIFFFLKVIIFPIFMTSKNRMCKTIEKFE